MSLTKQFREKPIEFLADYIIVVKDEREGIPNDQVVNFVLRRANANIAGNNFVFLIREPKDNPDGEVIPAYWLPWHKGMATALTLADKADFLFTSEMTGCRFSVLTGDMSKPTVAHGDGCVESGERDKFEVTAKLPARNSEDNKRMRRMSRSGPKNPLREVPKDKSVGQHHYNGQNGNKSSAFAFGHRVEGTWKFYAQVVAGIMAGGGIDALKTAKDKVLPMDQAYEIA